MFAVQHHLLICFLLVYYLLLFGQNGSTNLSKILRIDGGIEVSVSLLVVDLFEKIDHFIGMCFGLSVH